MKLKQSNILVVDDDPDVLTAVRLLLKAEANEVVTERNPNNLRALIAKSNFHLVLLDMNFSSTVNTGNEGLFWLKRIKEWNDKVAVIMITAYGGIDLAVRSLKEGASDFMVKPWHNEKLLRTLREALEKHYGNPKPQKGADTTSVIGTELIGKSEAMQAIFYKIEKVAATDANILIIGENGTGKDLIPKAIHQGSLRAEKPFVKVDVGALTDSLFESELFGHTKGAYTDAAHERTGRFEAANGGTLFLDEIGNISLRQQAKLLTVLQNREVYRLGSNEAIPIDIRLICATNATLETLSDESHFRRDLVYRINTVEILVPPLRKRKEDILLLAEHFAKIYAEKYFKPDVGFDQPAINKLLKYQYPGNVRELQYTIERAIIMADAPVLTEHDIVFSPIETPAKMSAGEETKLSTIEKNTILRVIEKNNGNITHAAKELGITRTALYRRLTKYGI